MKIIYSFLFGVLIFIALLILFIFYSRAIREKKTLIYLFKVITFNKINKYDESIIKIELIIIDFFKNKKRAFLLSFLFYLISGIFFIIEFKFLLLSIGINATIIQLILIINVWGLMNFAPSPSSLGFLEAGQSGLLYLLSGDGANGIAITLLLRISYLLVTVLGFFFISRFGYNRINNTY
jgi:uncharacterized membrane protein YbhN (UPF0104 family)